MRVILCRDLEQTGVGLSLEALRRSLAESHGADVRVSASGCAQAEVWLEGLAGMAGAEAGLLLGLCRAPASRADLLAKARRAGVPAGALQWVVLGPACAAAGGRGEATEKAKALLGAALARLRAGGGGGPANDKMVMSWEQKVSRRSLFRLPPVRYEVIPAVDPSRCAAAEGCRICADLCPHDALRVGDSGAMEVRKNPCTGCGACVSACPREALGYPGNGLRQIEAQVRSLLREERGRPRGVLFHCHNAAPRLEGLSAAREDWLPVELPCLGMVTPAWILGSLRLGAGAVGLLPCEVEECRFGDRTVLDGRVTHCRRVLEALGMAPGGVRILGEEDLSEADLPCAGMGAPEEDRAGEGETPFAPFGAAGAALALASRREGGGAFSLADDYAPLGAVSLSGGCTLCASCAGACPAGALSMEEKDTIALLFDPARCVGCGGCVPVCPENVIAVRKVTNPALLAGGQRVLFEDSAPRCVKCGAPVAPQAMLDKIRAALGDDPAYEKMSRYCLDCRKTIF